MRLGRTRLVGREAYLLTNVLQSLEKFRAGKMVTSLTLYWFDGDTSHRLASILSTGNFILHLWTQSVVGIKKKKGGGGQCNIIFQTRFMECMNVNGHLHCTYCKGSETQCSLHLYLTLSLPAPLVFFSLNLFSPFIFLSPHDSLCIMNAHLCKTKGLLCFVFFDKFL